MWLCLVPVSRLVSVSRIVSYLMYGNIKSVTFTRLPAYENLTLRQANATYLRTILSALGAR